MTQSTVEIQEGKAAATNRLRKEGRWDEASAFKDRIRAELKREGMAAEEAKEESWRRMIEAYPPLPEPEQEAMREPTPGRSSPVRSAYAEEILQLGKSRKRSRSKRIELLRDSQWVYQNIQREDVRPKDAPSLGAWSLLEWARSNSDEFYKTYRPRISRHEEKEAEKDAQANAPPKIQQA